MQLYLPRILVTAVACAFVPGALSAQAGCDFVYPTGDLVRSTLPGGRVVTYVSSPHMVCSDGVELWADSAVSDEQAGSARFLGNVRFVDGTAELRADEARYFTSFARVEAKGNVFVRDSAMGYELERGELSYLRVTATRLDPQITMTVGSDGLRPKAVIVLDAPEPQYPEDMDVPPSEDQDALAEEVETGDIDEVEVPTTTDDDSLSELTSVSDLPASGASSDSTEAETLSDSAATATVLDVADETEADTLPPVPYALEGNETDSTEAETISDSDTAAAMLDVADETEADTLPPVPYALEGNEILIIGNSYVRVTGNAVVSRDSLTAYADTAGYDGQSGSIDLFGSARVFGRNYEITGRTISLGMHGNAIDRLVAQGDAELAGGGVNVTAPSLIIDLDDDVVERLTASAKVPEQHADESTLGELPVDADVSTDPAVSEDSLPVRPVASSGNFSVTADSIEVTSPREVLERIFASGGARMISTAGALDVAHLPEVARNDWIEGDSISVTFQTPSDVDDDGSRTEPQVDRVVSMGRARSLYRMEPQPATDSTATPAPPEVDSADAAESPVPGLHYVTAGKITIVMEGDQVARLETEGAAQGFHLEPFTGPDSLIVDTVTAEADTTGINNVTHSTDMLRYLGSSVGSGKVREGAHRGINDTLSYAELLAAGHVPEATSERPSRRMGHTSQSELPSPQRPGWPLAP